MYYLTQYNSFFFEIQCVKTENYSSENWNRAKKKPWQKFRMYLFLRIKKKTNFVKTNFRGFAKNLRNSRKLIHSKIDLANVTIRED